MGILVKVGAAALVYGEAKSLAYFTSSLKVVMPDSLIVNEADAVIV